MANTNLKFDKAAFKREVEANVKTLYRKTLKEATKQQIFQAVSYAIKDTIIDNWLATQKAYDEQDPKIVYYMSMEFLMGRALGNNLINLQAYEGVKEALEELGLERSGLDRMIQTCYSLLGLISYLTAGKPEVRAWTITNGTKAPQAAGKIHSDFERGFIRAEVIAYDDFMACGGNMVTAKEKGLVRSEGKEYVMNDGDIVLFRFNV